MAGMKAHFSRTFAAAHRVWNDPGKCRNIHGHNYQVEVDVTADALTEQEFVVPFDAVKTVIDEFDHTLILDTNDPLWPELGNGELGMLSITEVPGVPSTESLAALIAERIATAVLRANPAARAATAEVALRETPSIQALASNTVRRPPA